MAYIKLPYNEKLNISRELAEKIKSAIEAKQDGDTPIEVSPTRSIRLRQVKDVDTQGSAEGVDRTEKSKYEKPENRECLQKVVNMVMIDGGFDEYAEKHGLIFPSKGGAGFTVNADRHAEYTDLCDARVAYGKLTSEKLTEEKLKRLKETREFLKEKFGFFRGVKQTATV